MSSPRKKSAEPLLIRSLHPAEVELLKPLWLEFMQYHAQFGPQYSFDPQEWPAVRARFQHVTYEENHLLLGAFWQKELVGYLFGFVFLNYPGYLPRSIGFINDLFVIPEQRRKGIGKALVTAAEEWFSEREVGFFQLSIAFPNREAKLFWEKCGYSPYSVGMVKLSRDGERPTGE